MALRPTLAVLEAPEASLTLLRGRKADRRTEAEDLRLEVAARQAEAVEMADFLLPLMAQLVNGCRELGPAHFQVAIAVRERLARYRRQNEPEPEGEVAA